MNRMALIIIIAALMVAAIFFFNRNNTNVTPDNDTLIIGTNAEFPPLAFKENNTIVGLDIDVALEVAKRLNKKAVIKDMTFDALIPEIQLGHIHMIAAGMSPTAEREKVVSFAPIHFKGTPLVIISLASEPINSVSELDAKNVVVNEGYIADFYVSEKPNIHITRLPTSLVSEGAMAVKSKRAHAFVAAQFSLQDFLKSDAAKDLHSVVIEDTNEPSALAISKAHAELVNGITKVINEMERDGSLKMILAKWNVQ